MIVKLKLNGQYYILFQFQNTLFPSIIVVIALHREMGGYMSAHQVENWMHSMGNFGYVLGFLLPFIESFIPVLPLFVFVFVNVDTFGLFLGIIVSWLGTFLGSFVVFLIVRAFANTNVMDKVKNRKDVRKFLNFVNKQGVTPIFIMLCFPFTPSALMNVVAGLSKMKVRTFFLVLAVSNLIAMALTGVLGRDMHSILSSPIRVIIMVLILAGLWYLSRRLEKRFMK